MFKRYIGVASYAHEIIVMTENNGSGNTYVVEALRSGRMFGTNDITTALKTYEQFCDAQDKTEHDLLFNA